MLSNVNAAQAPVVVAKTVQTPVKKVDSIDSMVYKYAAQYNVSAEVMNKVLFCESRFNPNAYNKNDPNGGSFGIAQFQKTTFEHYSKKAGIENGDYYNPDDSIKTMAYMFSLKQENQWSCYRIINN